MFSFLLNSSLQFPLGIGCRKSFFSVLTQRTVLFVSGLPPPGVRRLNYLNNDWLKLRATSRKSAYYGPNHSLYIPPNQSNVVCVESCESELSFCCSLLTVAHFCSCPVSSPIQTSHCNITLLESTSSTPCQDWNIHKSVIKTQFMFSSALCHRI